MKISVIQTDISWKNKEKNLFSTEGRIKNICKESDLVVLPELFTTGFCVDNLDLAETMNGVTVSTIKQWSRENDIAIAGSFLVVENEEYYNRAFLATPRDGFHYADKRHLFSLSKENKTFSEGKERLIVRYKEFNICLLICYDIRFPVWSRNVNNEYDLLIYIANFPHNRISAWDCLLQARAIENQSFVCGVNRIGTDGNHIKYSGHSTIYDFRGEKLLECEEYESNIKTATLSKEKLIFFRKKSAFWKDADSFNIST